MSQTILMNQFHVTVRVRRRLPALQLQRVRRVCNSAAFRRALVRAMRAAQRQFPALQPATVTVTS